MELFLIRHAIAAQAVEGAADAARPLTTAGRARMERVVRGLERLGVELDQLRHSPWVRAVETADLLARLCRGETVVEPLLARPPGRALLEALSGPDLGRRVALVGHQPWMGQLCGWLVFGSKARGAPLHVRKGSVAWLEGEVRPGGMTLEAFLPPRASRRMR